MKMHKKKLMISKFSPGNKINSQSRKKKINLFSEFSMHFKKRRVTLKNEFNH